VRLVHVLIADTQDAWWLWSVASQLAVRRLLNDLAADHRHLIGQVVNACDWPATALDECQGFRESLLDIEASERL